MQNWIVPEGRMVEEYLAEGPEPGTHDSKSGAQYSKNDAPGSPPAPLPHAKRRFLRQWMPELPRQHGDLTAVVRVVRN